MDSHTPRTSTLEELAEGKVYIRHPNDLTKRLEFDTMGEAMKYWKGFNTPYMKGDSYVESETKLKAYMKKLYDSQA